MPGNGKWHVLYRAGMSDDSEIKGPKVKAVPHETAYPVLTRPGFAVPDAIVASAELTDVQLTVTLFVRVASGGTIRVARLAVQPVPYTGAAVTSRALRAVKVDQLAREAVRQLERPVSMREDFAEGAFQITEGADIWANHGHMRNIRNPESQMWRSLAVPGRRLTGREQAEQAARIYAEAVASGSRAPTQAVAHELGYSRSQASRMIRAARDLGLLGDLATHRGPSIFRDPNGPRPWEGNEGKESSANDQDD